MKNTPAVVQKCQQFNTADRKGCMWFANHLPTFCSPRSECQNESADKKKQEC